MMLRRTRHVQICSLLCAVCHLTLAFPTQIPSANEDVWPLQVNIPHSGPIVAPLGSSIFIPCLVSLSSTPVDSSSSPVVPRVKWTVVSDGVETQILVARGQRVKINEAYRNRVALLNYTTSPDDVSLWLGDLQFRDSAHYRCEVQQGLEDASDVVQVKVKGVVFHYRDALGRYAFSFQQAQNACRSIGAQIATPDQLLAAFNDGYEQCDAGWLADQSVRYPIQIPRKGCYGDMDGQPGVRNYGTMDPNSLFDVYCYVEQINGEVFHDSIPQKLSFDEAQSYCGAAGAELATTAQMYFAWSEGLDRCSPGWLADGSVRYPIRTARERCGGSQIGVKTFYRFSNQTGFPDPSSLHDVYCFKENGKTLTTEAEDIEQNVIILNQTDEEIQLNQLTEQVEREVQSVLESVPFLPGQFTTETADTDLRVTPNPTDSSPSTTSAADLLQLFNETSEMSHDSQHPTEAMNTTISNTETYNSTQNTTFPPSVYNQTSFHQNLSFTFHQSEFERTTYKPHSENQTVSETKETTYPHEEQKQLLKINETTLKYDKSHSNYSESERSYTQEENLWESTTLTADPLTQVKLEEVVVKDLDPISLSTQAPQEKSILPIQVTQATESAIETVTSLLGLMEGSGDISQERDPEKKEVTTSYFSTTDFTTHPLHPALTSRAPTEPRTAGPDPTLSHGSVYVDKLGSEIYSTSPHLGESSSSRQEGSTSLEIGDMLTMGSDEIQIHTSQPLEWVVSEVSLTTTEFPEGLNTSQSPSEFVTAQNQTLSYRLYFDSSNSYEEASGYESGTVSSTFQEGNKFPTTLEEQTITSLVHEMEINVSLSVEKSVDATTHDLKEEEKVTPTLFLKGASVSSTTDKETMVAPTSVLKKVPKVDQILVLKEEMEVTPTHGLVEATKVAAALEEETKVSSGLDLVEEGSVSLTIEEEGTVTPTLIEDYKVVPTLVLEEEAKAVITLVSDKEVKVVPTPVLEAEAKATTNLVFEKEAKVVPTPVLEEEAKAATALVFEKEAKVVQTSVLEEEAKAATTLVFHKEAKVVPTPVLEEEAKAATALVFEKEAKVVQTSVLEEEAKAATTQVFHKEAKVVPTLVLEEIIEAPSTIDHEEDASVSLTLEEKPEVTPTLVHEKDKFAPALVLQEESIDDTTLHEKDKVSPTFVTEKVKVSPTLDLKKEANTTPTPGDFTIMPLSSQTSKSALLSTMSTTKESINDVKFSQRPPFQQFLDSFTSQMSVKSTAAAKTVPPTITTTRHVPRHTWSQTTTPHHKSIHEEVELQKVTHVIPPVDHGLVDLELSLTQPPTLHILPNERAAVGDTGKSSDACESDPCLNGGTCTDFDGKIICLCLPTYGGDNCQTDLEQCERGWDKFHGFCYRHFSQRQSWEAAEQNCRMQGAHLMSIMTPEEQDYINTNYKEYQWTGLNDKTIEDDFQWSDGNPLLYQNWNRGQPDSYFLSGENCVVMVWHDNGRWSDVPCNYHLAYTCKKGTSSCGPPPKIRNAFIFGKVRQRYETSAIVRYHCREGFQQRLNPLVKCLPGGRWQRPQILCLSEAGGPTLHPDESSLTSINFAAAENEFEATVKAPQYWDIKFS